jgi:hypothetical protein
LTTLATNKQNNLLPKNKTALAYKHPVEFSKNKPRLGATALSYILDDACQIFDLKILIVAIAQNTASTLLMKGSGGGGRPAGLRRTRPAPAG